VYENESTLYENVAKSVFLDTLVRHYYNESTLYDDVTKSFLNDLAFCDSVAMKKRALNKNRSKKYPSTDLTRIIKPAGGKKDVE